METMPWSAYRAGSAEDWIRAQIVADHRLAGHERAALRRTLVRPRDHAADDARSPADPSLDEQVVLLGPVPADLAKRDFHTFRTSARGLGQYLSQIAFAECEAAEPRERGLLPQKPCYLQIGGRHFGAFQHVLARRMPEQLEPRGKRWRGICAVDDLLDDLQSGYEIPERERLAQTCLAVIRRQGYVIGAAGHVEDTEAALAAKPVRDRGTEAAIREV
jgi:hypothetical protein